MNTPESPTPNSKLVSVVVPIYNGEADLPDLINCLRSQTYPSDRVEYLLVDNASSDRTSAILQTAAENYPQIRHLTENKIQSSYAARNTGIRTAAGEIIAFTDADCRPEPNWLSDLISPFQNPTIGIVAGEVVGLPGKTILEKYAENKDTLSQKYTLAHPFCPYGQTANLAIRREIFQQVGLFRPYMTTGGDADICWRIQRETDWKITLAESAIVKHRHRSTIAEFQSQWKRYGRSNRYLHELYGVKLMPSLKPVEYLYRISRWLLKELPITTVKAMMGKASVVDTIDTPIYLINATARSAGQKQAKLPEQAKIIDKLE